MVEVLDLNNRRCAKVRMKAPLLKRGGVDTRGTQTGSSVCAEDARGLSHAVGSFAQSGNIRFACGHIDLRRRPRIGMQKEAAPVAVEVM